MERPDASSHPPPASGQQKDKEGMSTPEHIEEALGLQDSVEEDLTAGSVEEDLTPDSVEEDLKPDSVEEDLTPDSEETDNITKSKQEFLKLILRRENEKIFFDKIGKQMEKVASNIAGLDLKLKERSIELREQLAEDLYYTHSDLIATILNYELAEENKYEEQDDQVERLQEQIHFLCNHFQDIQGEKPLKSLRLSRCLGENKILRAQLDAKTNKIAAGKHRIMLRILKKKLWQSLQEEGVSDFDGAIDLWRPGSESSSGGEEMCDAPEKQESDGEEAERSTRSSDLDDADDECEDTEDARVKCENDLCDWDCDTSKDFYDEDCPIHGLNDSEDEKEPLGSKDFYASGLRDTDDLYSAEDGDRGESFFNTNRSHSRHRRAFSDSSFDADPFFAEDLEDTDGILTADNDVDMDAEKDADGQGIAEAEAEAQIPSNGQVNGYAKGITFVLPIHKRKHEEDEDEDENEDLTARKKK